MIKNILKESLIKFVKLKKSFSKKEALLLAWIINFLPIPYTIRDKWKDAKSKNSEFKKGIEKESPLAYQYPNRILSEIHPYCKEKLIGNFLLEGIIEKKKIRKEVEKEGSFCPFTILFSPTMRCNLRCAGCYAKNYKRKDDLPQEVLEKIIKEGEEMGVVFYTILGGEPFLVFDKIYTLFRKYNQAYAQIFTNGTLITEEIAKKLQELGNIFVHFSVEGFEKETDERRGKGIFKKVMEGMDLLKKYGVPHGFSGVYSSKNASVLISDQFIDLMIEKGCLWGWYFLYMPVFGEKEDISLMPTPEQRYNLWKRHLEIRSKKPVILIDFWGDAPLVGGCIAGKYYIHINNKGDVEPCIFTHFALDNIKNKSLKEIMASPFLKEYRKLQPFSKNLLLPCPLIDHPKAFRMLFEKFNLHPTHPQAENFIKYLTPKIDRYSKGVHSVMDKVWKENYDRNYNGYCPFCS